MRQDASRKNLPAILDRWKEYTAMRKLIKYQFNFCQNQTANEKADL